MRKDIIERIGKKFYVTYVTPFTTQHRRAWKKPTFGLSSSIGERENKHTSRCQQQVYLPWTPAPSLLINGSRNQAHLQPPRAGLPMNLGIRPTHL